MSNSLSAFLTGIGANITQHSHCEFIDGNTDVSSNFIAPLTHYGLLSVQGRDAASFLQGQTTCNILDINEQHSLPGAYCTAQGRMVSSFRAACADQQTWFLRMRRQIVANTHSVLSKYIVFSKATQSDASDDYIIIGLYGDQAKAAIENTFGKAPDTQNAALAENGHVVIQLDAQGLMYECWIQNKEAASLWPTLCHNLTPVGSSTWELLTIRQGMGEVTQATIETFIPQMLNFQVTGAISFNKGCYTGQEVIARMHYRGKPKRRMYRIAIACAAPAPGSNLYRAQGGQSIGTIVNAVSTTDKNCEALAVITISDVNNNDVVSGPEALPVKILSLPYAITNNE